MVQRQHLKKTLTKLWENSLKEYDKMTNKTSKLLKTGEKNLKTASHSSKQKLEIINLTIKKEKLYYQLGKAAAKQPKNRWAKSLKIESLIKEIKQLDRQIKTLNSKKNPAQK
jgi:hypothetical protein